MDRAIYHKGFYEISESTKLICPECNKGELVIVQKNVEIGGYDTYNKKAKSHEDFDIDWLQNSFHGFLLCNKCHEKIAFAGKSDIGMRIYLDGEGPDCYDRLTIEYIERPPHIIEIHSKVPKKVKKIILDSFKLFWVDLNSCANKIRICLELIMDMSNIQKFQIVKHHRKPLSLHERIINFSKNDTALKIILTSIKWIGNYASHNENINKDDILDGYILLDLALKKIYVNNEKEIMKIASSINSSKKPRSKKPGAKKIKSPIKVGNKLTRNLLFNPSLLV